MLHQQPQAPQTDKKSFCPPPCSSSCHNREFRKYFSVEAPISPKNGMLNIAAVVQQIITELSEAVSERDKIMVIIKMVLV
jgi:hypothetical protein